jgi:DNA polymerase-3 subunit delta
VNLTPANISAQLSKGLAPAYFVYGDEPLIVDESLDLIRAAARRQGFDERELHVVSDARFNWDKLQSGLSNLSLFSTRKIVEVRLVTGKPGVEGSAAIVEVLNHLSPDTLWMFTAPKLDKATASSKWVKALQSTAVCVEVRALTPERLPAWIDQRMQAAGLACDAEAIQILADRVEGNLLAAQQEISKLALLAEGRRVTADLVRQSTADGARFDVFQLADAALAQDTPRAIRILNGLRQEGVAPVLTLWALVREINALVAVWIRMDQGAPLSRAMNDAGIWRTRQDLVARAVRGRSEAGIRRLLAGAGLADLVVKGARPGLPWNTLLELVLLIARPGRPTGRPA